MSATVLEDPAILSDRLTAELSGVAEPGKGMLGYRESSIIKRRGETLGRVLFGGNAGAPHLIASGAATDDVVPVLRELWGSLHEVTRMDTAQDFSEPGGFDRLDALLGDMSDRRGMSIIRIESVVQGVRSRTTYLGAPSSRIRVRLYEKGCFELQQGRAGSDPEWFRLEAQIRPTGAARVSAATLDPLAAWGLSPSLRELAESALGADVGAVGMQVKREPDFERALFFLQKQYGSTLAKAVEHVGSWEAVGALLASGDLLQAATRTPSDPEPPF